MTTRRTATVAATVAAATLLALAGLTACGSDAPAEQTPTPTDDMTDDSMVDDMTDDSMVDDMTDDSMVDDMTDDSMVDDMTDDSMVDEESMSDEPMPLADLAPFQSEAITDVDGVTFTLADLAGTPVMVEAFATWCSTCRAQLATTQEAAAAAGDAAVVLALSVETDLDAADVAGYADDNGFDDVRFAVASPEMLAALVEHFGNSIAVPPSTPKFYIDQTGHAGELVTGSESADDILGALGIAG